MIGGRIVILAGENSFEIAAEIANLRAQAKKAKFSQEKIDTDNLDFDQLMVAISGVSLFSKKRFVMIRGLSEIDTIWQRAPEIFAQISSDVFLCLIENSIDKRSKIYKELAKIVEFRDFKSLNSKDSRNLAEFARKIAKNQGESMDIKLANFLVSWVGPDEWKIADGISRLSLLGDFSESAIREFVPTNPESNSFDVLNFAFAKNPEAVLREILKLKVSTGRSGAHIFFGLISSQIYNLCVIKFGKKNGKTIAEIAKRIGANIWVLGRMENLANSLSIDRIEKIVLRLVKIDEIMKSESVDEWNLIESFLMEISSETL